VESVPGLSLKNKKKNGMAGFLLILSREGGCRRNEEGDRKIDETAKFFIEKGSGA